MVNMFVSLFLFFKIDIIINKLNLVLEKCEISRLKKQGINVNFVNQGNGGITIAGDLSQFHIDSTSHLKSNTFIECSGGVYIGKYFHTGRGLTVFSSNHNYNSTKIPYDKESILKSVIIKDFVWCGANVTILSGVTLGEGCIIGACSVVTSDIPDYAVAVGNPAKVVKYRDIGCYINNKVNKSFF